METSSIDISVVIPVYNSADCLTELMRQLTKTLDEMGDSYEVILVEDASPDNSWQVIEQLVPQYPRVSAIRLMRNCGQAKAITCGLAHARGDVVVNMDDDLQHRPDQLPKLLKVLEESPEVDCVCGHFPEKKHARYRNLGSRMILWVNARTFGLPRNLRWSSFRAMRKSLVGAILANKTLNPAIPALVFASTPHVVSIRVEHGPRYAGKSNYTLAKQFRLAFDNICNVSMLPLRAVAAMGMGICLLSAILVVNFLVEYVRGQSAGVAGWTTVVILISFFAGVTLLSLGIIGEYLVRVLREVRGAPRYLERERIGFEGGGVPGEANIGSPSSGGQVQSHCKQMHGKE